MSKSKWKSESVAKELLKRIDKLKVASASPSGILLTREGYDTSFDGLEFDSYQRLLRENIRSNDIPVHIHEAALGNAIFQAADDGRLNSGYVSNLIKEDEKAYREKDETEFFLVTAISVIGLRSKLKANTKHAEITLSKYFPKTFKKNYDFDAVKTQYPSLVSEAFSWVIVKVSSRCYQSAASLALSELNYFLGLLNHRLVPSSERQSFGKPRPLAKVRKFPVHHLFLSNGDSATSTYWYEPNFTIKGVSYGYDEGFKGALQHFRSMHKAILKTARYKFFQKGFSRYTEALESGDMEKVFLSLWALLENLTLTLKDNYATTINRTLVLFKDKFLAKQELEVLREKRNVAIHSGEGLKEAEQYACILIKYIRHYFVFMVNIMQKTNIEKDIQELLDLPTDNERLHKHEAQAEKQLEQAKRLRELIKVGP